MMQEDRIVDITATLDKVVVWLLLGSVVVLTATITAAQIISALPRWVVVVGVSTAVVLFMATGILGGILNVWREKIYQKWLAPYLKREPNFRVISGKVAQVLNVGADRQGGRLLIHYALTMYADWKDCHEIHIPITCPSDVNPPRVGENFQIVIATYYGKRGKEILQRTMFHRSQKEV